MKGSLGDRQQTQTHKNKPRNGPCLTQVPNRHGSTAPPLLGLPPGPLEAQEGSGLLRDTQWSGWVRETSCASRPPVSQFPRLKNLRPHLRPIVLAKNLGQRHWGEVLLLPGNSEDRSPGRSPGIQQAPCGLVQGQCEPKVDGWAGGRARQGAGPSREDGSCPNYSSSSGSNLV